jgi:hypothetical protein
MRKGRQPAPSNRHHHPEVQAHVLIAFTQQVAVVFAHVQVGRFVMTQDIQELIA